jgi:hypothetical protein
MKIQEHLSGHINFRSHYKTDGDCDNCDSDKCDNCKKIFSVSCLEGYFSSYDDANQALEDLYDLIPLEKGTYEIDSENQLFIHNNDLYIEFFDRKDFKTKMIQCNKDAKIYQIKFNKVTERIEKYKNCTCIDKDSNIELPCYKYGCTDFSCYIEMRLKTRKERKHYL